MASLVHFDMSQNNPVEVEFGHKGCLSIGLKQGTVSYLEKLNE
jgi:hypothetical protein